MDLIRRYKKNQKKFNFNLFVIIINNIIRNRTPHHHQHQTIKIHHVSKTRIIFPYYSPGLKIFYNNTKKNKSNSPQILFNQTMIDIQIVIRINACITRRKHNKLLTIINHLMVEIDGDFLVVLLNPQQTKLT